MSLAPMSSSATSVNPESATELRVAVMAKNQQKAEGAAAMQLLETAGQAAPKPVGNAGHNINVMA